MANSDTPFGLRPLRHRNGAPYNGAVNYYYVLAGYATALFLGDPVVKTGTSNTAGVKIPGAGDFDPGTLPTVNKATAGDGNAITGVVVGVFMDPDDSGAVYKPASTEAVLAVADDPDLVFEIQDDGAAALAATSVGLNAVLIYTHAGSTSTGLSGVELDTNSDAPAADASNQLTILRLKPELGNEIAANAVWEVKINNHSEAHGAVGL